MITKGLKRIHLNTSKVFIISIPNVPDIRVTRAQLLGYSNDYNFYGIVSDVGSDDFYHSLVDYLCDIFDEHTGIIESASKSDLASWISILR